MTERLQKIIAQAGIGSRRAAEQLILEGRVRVNGQVVLELGTKADPQTDRVEIEGLGELKAEPLVYVALYKPIHVVSTVDDPERRQTVVELVGASRAQGNRVFEGNMPRVYPVGRLDFDAEGLILLTNDGTMTQNLLHPRHHVPKTYMVKVRGVPDERALQRLRAGLRMKNDDGTWSRPTAPAEVQLVKQGRTNSWLEMTIFEGRNHQVKRMCEAVGHFCVRLVRTHFAAIGLDELPPGGWRFLHAPEVKALKAWPDKAKANTEPRRAAASRGAGPASRGAAARGAGKVASWSAGTASRAEAPGRSTSRSAAAPSRGGKPASRSAAPPSRGGKPASRSAAPSRGGKPASRSAAPPSRGGKPASRSAGKEAKPARRAGTRGAARVQTRKVRSSR